MQARNSWLNINLFIDSVKRNNLLSTEKPLIRVVDTDNFWEGDTTRIRTVNGYKSYIWNDTIISNSNELKLSKGGKYWVRIKEDSCYSPISDTLIFVAKGKIKYDLDSVYAFNDSAKVVNISTIPADLSIQNSLFLKSDSAYNEVTEIKYPGQYLIKTAIVEPYNKGQDSCTLIVNGIYIEKHDIIISLNEQYQSTTMVETGNDSIGYSWSSDDETIAIVDSDGVIQGISEGSTIIRIATSDNSYADSCWVKVEIPTSVLTNNTEKNQVKISSTANQINIKWDDCFDYQVTLIDIASRLYGKYVVKSDSYAINVKYITPGIYFVIVDNGKERFVQKIIL